MRIPSYIRECNDLLRRELDAIFPHGDGVHPCFELRRGSDLKSMVPVYRESNGICEPVMEYRCKCGVDRVIHTFYRGGPKGGRRMCDGLTVAKTKMQIVSALGLEGEFSSYPKKCWVLCRWNAPPPLDVWVRTMGTDEDYPREGRYLPVHAGPQLIVIPPHAEPPDFLPATQRMIEIMKKHVLTFRAQLQAQQEKDRALQIPIEDIHGNVIREPAKDSKYNRVLDRLNEYSTNSNLQVGYTPALQETKECPTP
jgi:hypothetical protein